MVANDAAIGMGPTFPPPILRVQLYCFCIIIFYEGNCSFTNKNFNKYSYGFHFLTHKFLTRKKPKKSNLLKKILVLDKTIFPHHMFFLVLTDKGA